MCKPSFQGFITFLVYPCTLFGKLSLWKPLIDHHNFRNNNSFYICICLNNFLCLFLPYHFLLQYLPSKFAKRYLVKQPSHAILRVSSERTRTWSVNFHYVAARTTFQVGWLDFVRANDLKTGDACIFMLTDNIKFLFDVVFFRAT